MLIPMPRGLGVALLATLLLQGYCVRSDGFDEYDYGDPSVAYDALDYKDSYDNTHAAGRVQPVIDGKLRIASVPQKMPLPLCCEEGMIFDQQKCIFPPNDFNWKPKLDGAPTAKLLFGGFPSCSMKQAFIETYQKEVTFNELKGVAFLPYYVRLRALDRSQYCIAKVRDPDLTCEDFQTKVFSCYMEKKTASDGVIWTSVAISHLFIVLTLFAFFFVSELRCLQGQYLICFLISLLIYNLCLFPGSVLPLEISDVSCIALGAVKYFFFCGVFLWFNTLCFDVWRTLRNKQDISGRRRFLFYSAYSWAGGAILTTVVLVMPYMNDSGDQSRDDPLKDGDYHACKLKMEMNIILQIAQLMSLVLDLIFLVLASCSVCSYSKFGNGLPRCEASLCLKQGWKLLAIMVAHTVNSIDRDMLPLPVPMWMYLLLESAAIFGVFAYRRTVLKKILSGRVCQSACVSKDERGSVQEKGQLTVA